MCLKSDEEKKHMVIRADAMDEHNVSRIPLFVKMDLNSRE